MEEGAMPQQFPQLLSELREQKTQADPDATDALYARAAEFYREHWGTFFTELEPGAEDSTRKQFWDAIVFSLQQEVNLAVKFQRFSAYFAHFLTNDFSATLFEGEDGVMHLLGDLSQEHEASIISAFSNYIRTVQENTQFILEKATLYLTLTKRMDDISFNASIKTHSTKLYFAAFTDNAELKRGGPAKKPSQPKNQQPTPRTATPPTLWQDILFNQSSGFWNIILFPLRIFIVIPILLFTAALKEHSKERTPLNRLRDGLADGLLWVLVPEKNFASLFTHLIFWISIGGMLAFDSSYMHALHSCISDLQLSSVWNGYMRMTASTGIIGPMTFSMLFFAAFSLVCHVFPWWSRKFSGRHCLATPANASAGAASPKLKGVSPRQILEPLTITPHPNPPPPPASIPATSPLPANEPLYPTVPGYALPEVKEGDSPLPWQPAELFDASLKQ